MDEIEITDEEAKELMLAEYASDLNCHELMEERFPGGFTIRDEANAIVAWAFRNGPLENLHAGEDSKLLEDSSLSRITDEEMKVLMLFACEQVEWLLRLKKSDPKKYDLMVKAYNLKSCDRWKR